MPKPDASLHRARLPRATLVAAGQNCRTCSARRIHVTTVGQPTISSTRAATASSPPAEAAAWEQAKWRMASPSDAPRMASAPGRPAAAKRSAESPVGTNPPSTSRPRAAPSQTMDTASPEAAAAAAQETRLASVSSSPPARQQHPARCAHDRARRASSAASSAVSTRHWPISRPRPGSW